MASDNYELYGGKTKRAFYEAQLGVLKSERGSFDSHWRDLADWIMPRVMP